MEKRHYTFEDIKKLNGGSNWKTNRVIDHLLIKNKIVKVLGKKGENYLLNETSEKELKYRRKDFEPPIGLREWIAWIIAILAILANIVTAII